MSNAPTTRKERAARRDAIAALVFDAVGHVTSEGIRLDVTELERLLGEAWDAGNAAPRPKRTTVAPARRPSKPKTSPIPSATLKAAREWNEAAVREWRRRGVIIETRAYPTSDQGRAMQQQDETWGDAWIIDPKTMSEAMALDAAVVR